MSNKVSDPNVEQAAHETQCFDIEGLDGSRLAIAPGTLIVIQTNCLFPSVEIYTKIVRSELRNSDGRACRVDKLFHNLTKLQLINFRNNYSICSRKHSASRGITARTALNDDEVDKLVQFDEGYRILNSIRSSPAHWESEKKDMAMIRQFGIPSFFELLRVNG